MKKFLKDYLGLLAAIGLAGGSLFAFNISTSIDNALQVIQKILVTPDGTLSGDAFITMDGSGKTMGIGVTNPLYTIQGSGSFLHTYTDDSGKQYLIGANSVMGFGTFSGAGSLLVATGSVGFAGVLTDDLYRTSAALTTFDTNSGIQVGIVARPREMVMSSVDYPNNTTHYLTFDANGISFITGTVGALNNPTLLRVGLDGKLSLLNYSFPIQNGSANQVLTTNGGGQLYWSTITTGSGGPQYWTQSGNDMYPTTLGNNIGIGTNTPSETFAVSGTFESTFTNPYGTFSLIGNNTIFGGTPGAGSYVTSGNEFLFAGVDHDGDKLSSELAYTDGDISQFINVSQAGPGILWQSNTPSLHHNGLGVTSTGVRSFIKNINIGPAAFTWESEPSTELMRITNSGNVGIGTTDPTSLLNVSGSFLAQHNKAAISVSPGLYSGLAFYPLPTASLLINDPSATGLTTTTGISAQVSVYDTRAINPSDPTVGATIATFSPNPFNQNQRAAVSVQNATEIALDAQSGAIHTSLDVESDRLEIYSSGGASSMYFDGIVGLFGFGTTTPDNTIDIGGAYINGTAGLRLSPFAGNSGQILGVNNDGDVVMLGNIGGFGGGGPQYWAQSGNSIYPTTLTNNVGIGINDPSTRLGIAGSILATSGSSRGWEFANDTLVNGLNRIGGWFTSGTQYVQNTITDLYNGLPIANMGWFDTNTNEESNFSAFQQSVTMHYNSDRTSTNSGLRNGIDVTPSDVEIKYDQNNISGNYIELNLGPLGFGVNGFGFTHMFTNSGYVGINNINPSHTLTVSGTFLANDGSQGLAIGPNLLGMGIPGAMNTYTTGTQLGFMFAGNPSGNPVFDAGAGAFLGFIDMVGFNDRAILSVKSGSIEFGVDQGGIDEIEFDFNTEYWSVESNSGFDNLWMDFNNNFLGINTASPQKALHVSGAIVSSAMFIGGASSFSGTIDVQNVNTIFVDAGGGNIDIHGLTNGTVGQNISIIRTDNTANTVTIYNLSSGGGNGDFSLAGGLDIVINTNFGRSFTSNGWLWYSVM